MFSIGHSYSLSVVKQVDFGVYLDADNLGEVLLPKREMKTPLDIGDSAKVFLYLDSEDRLIATTRKPKVHVGQFAYLPVVAVSHVGAFLDWGLDKDLLVPFGEQHKKMEQGKSYLVHVYINKADNRIVASSKIDKFLGDPKPETYKRNQAVDLIIASSTPLGFKAIINHRHWGLLNKNEVFQRLSFGQSIQGFIQHVRADGKVNITLNGGYQSQDKNVKIVLNHLQKNQGRSTLHDKSDPDLVSAELGISKGAFKKAIGHLYKQGVITIEKDHIRLND